jgi:crossover junction endodeoxyribonuclease RuvC
VQRGGDVIIVGIDPGTAICGYGAVKMEGSRLIPLTYGAITTPAGMPMPSRLQLIHDGLGRLLDQYSPDCLAVESLFFNKNVTTGITVGQARGVIILAAAQREIPVVEFTPTEVKSAVVGYGKAEKAQVQYMVQRLLCLKEKPRPDDTADALAIAICALHEANSLQRKGWIR